MQVIINVGGYTAIAAGLACYVGVFVSSTSGKAAAGLTAFGALLLLEGLALLWLMRRMRPVSHED
jgi:hypothetical protein